VISGGFVASFRINIWGLQIMHEHEHGHEHDEQMVDHTLGDKLAAFADEYWPAFVITFGAFFIFAIPFHYNIR